MFKVLQYHEIYGATCVFMGNKGECQAFVNSRPVERYVSYKVFAY